MRVLRKGMTGADVKRWQLFLVGQGFAPGTPDGDFGPKTEEATRAFQQKHGLDADGVVGLKTLGWAMQHGFPGAHDPDPGTEGPNWPPAPSFPPLTNTAQRQRLFGKFAYEPAPEPDNPEAIRILGDWQEKNVLAVEVPQLVGVPGAPRSGKVRFHRLAAKALQTTFTDWQKAGLLDRVLAWDGSFAPRFIRGSRKTLSNHAFATAFDINAEWNPLGAQPALVGEKGCVRELVVIANKHGFFWGGHYSGRLDGMHFEIAVL